MANFREIISKAVISKGKKTFSQQDKLEVTNKPTTVLGCWVINHQFKGYKSGENINVDGSYDVNIWYSYEDDSKTTVVNKKIDYSDSFNVKTNNELDPSETDVIVRSLKQPSCINVKIKENGEIEFEIEKELGIEIVGESKMKIAVELDEEPWEDLNETKDDIDEINDDYLN